MRYSVLQYIFGGYEKVHEIQEKDPQAEYLLVTDNPSLKSDTWNVVYDQQFSGKDPVWSSWYVRFHLFDFVNTSICITMDADTIIRKSLKPIVDMLEEGQYDMAMMPHPCRDSLDKEYAAWVKGRRYPESQAVKCIQFAASIGYDPCKSKGIMQGNFQVRRDTRDNDDYQRITWAFLKLLAEDRNGIERVDQNVASIVLNKFFSNAKILPLSEQVVRSEALTWCYHGTDKPKLDAYAPDGKTWNLQGQYDFSKPDIKKVLGKDQECFYWIDGKLKKGSKIKELS